MVQVEVVRGGKEEKEKGEEGGVENPRNQSYVLFDAGGGVNGSRPWKRKKVIDHMRLAAGKRVGLNYAWIDSYSHVMTSPDEKKEKSGPIFGHTNTSYLASKQHGQSTTAGWTAEEKGKGGEGEKANNSSCSQPPQHPIIGVRPQPPPWEKEEEKKGETTTRTHHHLTFTSLHPTQLLP